MVNWFLAIVVLGPCLIGAFAGWRGGRVEMNVPKDIVRPMGLTLLAAVAWSAVFVLGVHGVTNAALGGAFTWTGFLPFLAVALPFAIPLTVIVFIVTAKGYQP